MGCGYHVGGIACNQYARSMEPTNGIAYLADKAKEVMDGVNKGTYDHSLLSEWKDVFSYGKNHHNETLLGIDYNSNFGGWQEWDSQLSSCHQSGKLWSGWGHFFALNRSKRSYIAILSVILIYVALYCWSLT